MKRNQNEMQYKGHEVKLSVNRGNSRHGWARAYAVLVDGVFIGVSATKQNAFYDATYHIDRLCQIKEGGR